jgi:hypothetical protein
VCLRICLPKSAPGSTRLPGRRVAKRVGVRPNRNAPRAVKPRGAFALPFGSPIPPGEVLNRITALDDADQNHDHREHQ